MERQGVWLLPDEIRRPGIDQLRGAQRHPVAANGVVQRRHDDSNPRRPGRTARFPLITTTICTCSMAGSGKSSGCLRTIKVALGVDVFNLLNKNTVTSITTQSGAELSAASRRRLATPRPCRSCLAETWSSRSITPSERPSVGGGLRSVSRSPSVPRLDPSGQVSGSQTFRSVRGRSVSVRTHSASKPPSGRALPVGAGV